MTDGALQRVVKAYDIRGVVGSDLDAGVLFRLGRASAHVLGEADRPFVLGHDMRASSPELAAAFGDGVRSAGLEVIEIGLATTDTVYFASGSLAAPAAVITASHNPAEYNGVKLCRSGAVPVSIDTGLAEIRDLAAAGGGAAAATPGTVSRRDLTADFAAHVRGFVDTTVLDDVEVVVDAGNGMAGHLWPHLVAGTGVVTTPLYFELDGTFPNHPADPLDTANLADLSARVVADSAALGLAFDGDADRVIAVDEHGRSVSSSVVGALVAERLLAAEPGAVILYNLICSRAVPEVVRAAGGTPVRTRVGHSFIKAEMAQTDAAYAVEHSGHHYFRDNYRADSGAIAALLLLEAVASQGRGLSEVLAPYERYSASGEISVAVEDATAALERVTGAFAGRGAIDRLDGVSIDVGRAWFNLRASNTEPLVRLNVEGEDADAVAEVRDEVLAVVRGADDTTPRRDAT